jgi:predicted transcriptional regulator
MKKTIGNDAKLLEFIYDCRRRKGNRTKISDITERFSLDEEEAGSYVQDLENSHLIKYNKNKNRNKEANVEIRQEGIRFFQNHNRTVQEKISSSTETLFTIAILAGTGAQIYISRSLFPDSIYWKAILGGFGFVVIVALLLSWDNLIYSLKEKTWNRLERRFKLSL